MLTATYALVTLSLEQARMRSNLLAFQQYVHAHLRPQSAIGLKQLQYASDSLDRLYQACRQGKIETYLIPAIRRATQQADALLDELAGLNGAALAALQTLRDKMEQGWRQHDVALAQYDTETDAFCAALLRRLEKEESELFGIARSVICGKTWFAIANQFLLHDARLRDTRRGAVAASAPPPPSTLPAAATASCASASPAIILPAPVPVTLPAPRAPLRPVQPMHAATAE